MTILTWRYRWSDGGFRSQRYDRVVCNSNHDADDLGVAKGQTYQFACYDGEDCLGSDNEQRDDTVIAAPQTAEDVSEREEDLSMGDNSGIQHGISSKQSKHDEEQPPIHWQVAAPLASTLHSFVYRRADCKL